MKYLKYIGIIVAILICSIEPRQSDTVVHPVNGLLLSLYFVLLWKKDKLLPLFPNWLRRSYHIICILSLWTALLLFGSRVFDSENLYVISFLSFCLLSIVVSATALLVTVYNTSKLIASFIERYQPVFLLSICDKIRRCFVTIVDLKYYILAIIGMILVLIYPTVLSFAVALALISIGLCFMNKSGPASRVDDMSGYEFEHFSARWLLRSGTFHDVSVTSATGDFGADIIAYDREGRKWVFQCKRYSRPVGNKPIQEVVAAKSHYDATQAGVITNSRFTENAKQLAEENDVLLIDRNKLGI